MARLLDFRPRWSENHGASGFRLGESQDATTARLPLVPQVTRWSLAPEPPTVTSHVA